MFPAAAVPQVKALPCELPAASETPLASRRSAAAGAFPSGCESAGVVQARQAGEGSRYTAGASEAENSSGSMGGRLARRGLRRSGPGRWPQ